MRNNKHKIKTHNLIFIYIITTIIITLISFSRYVTTVTIDTDTRVALMADSISVDLNLADGIYPGFEAICPIVITNKDERGNIWEVSQQFTIEIEREKDKNLPLSMILYEDKNCTEIIEPDEKGIYISSDFRLNAGVEETKTYYLKINWPSEENDIELSYEIGYLKVNVAVTQVD